jgi:chemotaxis signal transduction protein
LLGVANLNGSLRSVVDIRVLLSLPDDTTDGGYVILLRNSGRSFGIWAQELDGVSHICLDGLMDADCGETNAHGGVVRGVTEDHTLVLDIGALMTKVANMTRQTMISPS